MNANFPRWLMSSLSIYFKSVSDSIPLEFFVEGVDERNEENMEQQHAELRITGPYVTVLNRGYEKALVEINVLLTDYMAMTQENAYEIAEWGGIFLDAMLQAIPIYRYGDGPGDDGTLIGCLLARTDYSDPVKLIHFGQVSKVDRVRQAVIDGKFVMYLQS